MKRKKHDKAMAKRLLNGYYLKHGYEIVLRKKARNGKRKRRSKRKR